MTKIKFEPGLELEHEERGEYILRFKMPKVNDSDLTGGHLKQARNEVLLAVRSLIDKAITSEGEKKRKISRVIFGKLLSIGIGGH
jgi:hypothetical protein